LKSGSQRRKVKKDREKGLNEGSQVLTNLFSKNGEHKHLNTQDETPFSTTSVIGPRILCYAPDYNQVFLKGL
jgi:hypothetical protein